MARIRLHLDGDYSPRWVVRRILVQLGKLRQYLRGFEGSPRYEAELRKSSGWPLAKDGISIYPDRR